MTYKKMTGGSYKSVELKDLGWYFLYKTKCTWGNQIKKKCEVRGGGRGSIVNKNALFCRIIWLEHLYLLNK